MDEHKTEIDVVLIKKENRQFMRYVKAIRGRFQHALVIAERCEDQEAMWRKSYKLMNVGEPNLWGHFNDGVIKACDEVCWKNEGGKEKEIHGGGMKRRRRQIQGRKMHTRRCDGTVLRTIKGGIKEKEKNWPNRMSKLVKGLKTDSKGGRCMWESNGKPGFSEKERGYVWKDYMERIMNIGWVQVEEVWRLWLPEPDVSRSCLGGVVSCCMVYFP